MRYIADAAQMKEIDRRTSEEIGIPAIVLMERAAEQIARQAVELLGGQENLLARKHILVVYGAGGNGGDAVAAARLLKLRGASVCLYSADNKTPCKLTKKQLAIARKCGVEEVDPLTESEKTGKDIDFSAYDIILDGIFGIGLSREVGEEYRALIMRINEAKSPVLSIDIPSGIHAGTGECLGAAVRATLTVTFGEYKIGHFLYPGAFYCGRIVLADAGFVPKFNRRILLEGEYQYFTYERSDREGLLSRRVPHSNKGSYGKVLIYAGSADITGAAYLAAKAAYRCGVGLVKLLSAPKCVDTVRRMLPEALYRSLQGDEDAEFFSGEVAWADAILAGPWIWTGEESAKNLSLLLEAGREQKKPFVLDADALNLLAKEADCQEKEKRIQNSERLVWISKKIPKNSIITPHPRELSRLMGRTIEEITEHFIDTARQCIYNNHLIYVLKDASTLVACEKEIYINRSGCDGMATGGSGDVLSGMIVGLCVKEQAYRAATAGVFLHGLAGEYAEKLCGRRAMLAGDILDGMLWLERDFSA